MGYADLEPLFEMLARCHEPSLNGEFARIATLEADQLAEELAPTVRITAVEHDPRSLARLTTEALATFPTDALPSDRTSGGALRGVRSRGAVRHRDQFLAS